MNAAHKGCCRCGATKPLDGFHRRARATDGRNPACKDCICAARREWRAAHVETERAAFKVWRAGNRERHLVMNREWRQRNVFYRAAYSKEYAAAHRQEISERKKAWYRAHREHVIAWAKRNPERSAELRARYREAHRDELAEESRQRRAGVRGVVVDLLALWTGRCGICGLPLDPDIRWPDPMSKSVDHIEPLARGGKHEQANLQWAHLGCNCRKGARLASEVGELLGR